MAGEDFFLRFGSNAEDFGAEVESGVRRAYAQLNDLSRAVDRLNVNLRDSPMRDFASSVQDEMRGIARTVSRTLATELRNSLRRELPDIARGLNLQVEATVAPATQRRSNATQAPENARVAAASNRVDREAQGLSQEAQQLIAKTRRALADVDQTMLQTFDRMSTEQQSMLVNLRRTYAKMQAEIARFDAGTTPARGRGRQTREMALEDPERGIFRETSAQVDDMGAQSAEAAQQIQQLRNRIRDLGSLIQGVLGGQISGQQFVERARRFSGEGSTGSRAAAAVAMDPEAVQAYTAASQTQLRAAQTMEQAVNRLGGNLEQIQAALRNVRVAERAERATPREPVAQQEVAQQNSQVINQTSDLLSDTRRYTQQLFEVLAPLRQQGTRGFAKRSKELLENDPIAREARENLSAAAGEEAVVATLKTLQAKTATLEDVMGVVEANLREQAPAIERTTQSERKVATANDQGARARQAQTAAVTAGAGDAAAVAAGGPRYGPPVPSDIANRRVREATARQRTLRSIVYDDERPEGATKLDPELGLAQQIANEYSPIFDRRAVLQEAIRELGVGGRAETNLVQTEVGNRIRGLLHTVDDDMLAEARRTLSTYDRGRVMQRQEGDLGDDVSTFGERPRDPQMERVLRAREVVEAGDLRDRILSMQRAYQAMEQIPDLSVEDVESLPTGSAQQGRARRQMADAMERLDDLIVRHIDESYSEQDLDRLEPFEQGARRRVSEREERRVADEALFQQKIEAAGRTERVQQGGLRNLAGFVEAPEGAQIGVDVPRSGLNLRRVSVPREDTVAELFGQNEFSEGLINTYNTAMEQARDLNRQRLLRSEAQQALDAGEAAQGAGLPVDEREMASARRIIARTEGVIDKLRATLERVLVAPDPRAQPDLFRAQQGRSISDLIFRGSASQMRAEIDAPPDPEISRVLAARRSMQERLAGEAGLNLADIPTGEINARLQEALPDRDVGRAMAEAENRAVQRARAEERTRRGQMDVASSFDDLNRGLIRSSERLLRGPNIPGLREGIQAQDRRGYQNLQSELTPFRGREESVRRAAAGGGDAIDFGQVIESAGGMDAVVDRMGRQMGLISDSDDLSLSDVKEELRNAPERLAQAEQRAAEETEQLANLRRQKAQLEGRIASGDLAREDLTRDQGLLLEGRTARTTTTRDGRQMRTFGPLESQQELAQANVQREMGLVEELARVENRRRDSTVGNEIARSQIRRELEGAVAGEGTPEMQEQLQRLATRQMERMTTALRSLEAMLRQVGRSAGLQPREVSGARSYGDVARRVLDAQRPPAVPDTMRVDDLYQRIQRAPTGSGVQSNWLEASMLPASQEVVEGYRRRMREGQQIEPVVLDDQGQLSDGFHRLRAAMLEGVESLPVTTAEQRAQQMQDANRRAERAVAQDPTTGRMSDTRAADLRARGVQPTLRIPATDAGMVDLAGFLEGGKRLPGLFSDTFDQILTEGRRMVGQPYEDSPGRTSRIRNQLGLLAGEDYYNYVTPDALEKRAGLSRADARAVGTQGPAGRMGIDQELIDAAIAGRDATAAFMRTDADLGGAEARTIEGRTNEQLLRVLSQLEGTMGQLIECCRAMRQGVRGDGREAPAGRATEYASGERLRGQVAGPLDRRLAQMIGRGELAEAGMELMADPDLAFDATEARRTIQQMFNEQASATQGRRFDESQEASVGRDLRQAQYFRNISEGAFGAFRAGDVENTGRAMVKAGQDVQGTLNTLRRTFDLTKDQVAEMRPSLEAYRQQLERTKQTTQEAATARQPLTDEERYRRDQYGRGLESRTGQLFVPGDQTSASRIGRSLVESGESADQAMRAVNRAFVDLDVQARRNVEGVLRTAQSHREAAAAAAVAQRAEERLARLRELLPSGMRQQLDAGELSGRQVVDYFASSGGQGLTASPTRARNVQAVIDEGQAAQAGTLDVDEALSAQRQQATRAGSEFAETYAESIRNANPLQQVLGSDGSLVGNVLRTTGNFIGRYIGGAIVFGLAFRLRELIGIALEVEQTFIRVQAALDATGKASDGVKERLQDIAVATNVDLASTYEVMAQLVGVFDSMEEAARATEVVNQMELISQGALTAREGYRALTAVVTSFQETLQDDRGLTQEQSIGYVADLATRIQDITGVNVEDTVEGLGRLGQTANAMGIEMEFLASTLALAGKTTGQTGSVVSEAFGRVLSQLQDSQALDMLVRLGITDEATARARNFQQIMLDLFGGFDELSTGQQQQVGNIISDPRQFYIVNAALQQGADILDIYQESMNNSGAASDRTEKILGTLRGQIGQLGKQVQVFVESLVDIGALNAFGVLVQGASMFLSVINQILQTLNSIKGLSPIIGRAVDLGMAVGGLVILMRLVDGVFAQMGRYVGRPESTGVGDTFGGMREGMARRRAERRNRQPATRQGGRAREWWRSTAPYPAGGDIDPTLDLARRRRAAAEGLDPTSPVATQAAERDAARRRRITERSPILRRGRQAGRWASGTRFGGWVAEGLQDPTRTSLRGRIIDPATGMPRSDTRLGRLEGRMRGGIDRSAGQGMQRMVRGARAMGPALLGAGLAFSLMVDLVTRKAREMSAVYDNLYEGPGQADETRAETEERKAREEADSYARRTARAEGPGGVANNFGEFLRFGASSWGNAAQAAGTLGATLSPQGIGTSVANMLGFGDGGDSGPFSAVGDALAGQLSDAHQGTMDGYVDSILHARDNMSTEDGLEETNRLRQELREQADELIESQPTTATKAEMARQIDAVLGLADTSAEVMNAAIAGLGDVTNFTLQQIETASEALQFIAGLNNRTRAKYGDAIQAILESQGLPDEALSALNSANQTGTTYTGRLQALMEAQDLIIDQAELELSELQQEGSDASLDDIDAARQRVEQEIQRAMELTNQMVQAMVDLPRQAGEYALRFGSFQEAQRLLSDAARQAERLAGDEDPGSPEQLDLLSQSLDLMRQSVEASIQGEILSLETLAAQSRDPREQLGSQLEVARTRLEAALANPGAFSPEDIAGFIQEIAGLQQQIADEQNNVTAALAQLRISQERSPVESANMEYAEAMREYNRAIDEDLGAGAVLQAAQQAEEAARNMREQEEELRAATSSLRIAQLPQGDSFRIAMAELEEAFAQQVHTIREFGRDSSQYQESMEAVLDLRRQAEDAVEEIAAAHAGVAIALANAAGLDIEVARLELAEAQRNLSSALRQAGGNEDAAIVQEAMSEVIQAEAAMRDTVLDEATSTIDFMLDMGEITTNQAIASLREIMNTMDLTEDQRRSLMQRIKGLQDDLSSQLSGGFNIADVRLPTAYEVRRSLGIDRITEGVEEGQAALRDAFDSADEAAGLGRGGAGGSALDQVLGADLANEVRNVGSGVDSLLPPLSEVPTLVQETIANRETIVAEAERQVQELIRLRETQNSSVQQLGAQIVPPMDLIQEDMDVMASLTEQANELLLTGNEGLAALSEDLNTGTSGVINAIQSLPEGFIEALSDWQDSQGHREPRRALNGPGSSYGLDPFTGRPIARAIGGPATAHQAYMVGEQGRELFVPNTSGYIIRAQDLMPMRDSAMGGGGGSVTHNRFETSVTVQAETNADANQIARVVERRVSDTLRRQINANQSTPHLIRMR